MATASVPVPVTRRDLSPAAAGLLAIAGNVVVIAVVAVAGLAILAAAVLIFGSALLHLV